MSNWRFFSYLLFWAALCAAPLCTQACKTESNNFGQPHISAVNVKVEIIPNAKVVNFRKVIYRGKMDVNPTLKRIRGGKKLSHRNDGAYFQNRERLLPQRPDRKYYREFVHKMKGFPFPGPQRVIISKRGQVWYTGDHYKSFTRVKAVRVK